MCVLTSFGDVTGDMMDKKGELEASTDTDTCGRRGTGKGEEDTVTMREGRDIEVYVSLLLSLLLYLFL